MKVRIGIISDTHNFFNPRIPKLFEGVEHILHGGDIGLPWIVLELEAIAPVTAVLGNTDDSRLHFKETESVELASRKFLVHHIVDPHALTDPIKGRIAREQPQIVVFGHTHKPFAETIGGRFYFNPGYAGQSRFGLERSVAVLHCDAKSIRPQFLPL